MNTMQASNRLVPLSKNSVPEQGLKPNAQPGLAHGGGLRVQPALPDQRVSEDCLRWIAEMRSEQRLKGEATA